MVNLWVVVECSTHGRQIHAPFSCREWEAMMNELWAVAENEISLTRNQSCTLFSKVIATASTLCRTRLEKVKKLWYWLHLEESRFFYRQYYRVGLPRGDMSLSQGISFTSWLTWSLFHSRSSSPRKVLSLRKFANKTYEVYTFWTRTYERRQRLKCAYRTYTNRGSWEFNNSSPEY